MFGSGVDYLAKAHTCLPEVTTSLLRPAQPDTSNHPLPTRPSCEQGKPVVMDCASVGLKCITVQNHHAEIAVCDAAWWLRFGNCSGYAVVRVCRGVGQRAVSAGSLKPPAS